MTTSIPQPLSPLCSRLLADENCRHGFFSRHGGHSANPYESLNVGIHVGDDVSAVAANRQLIKEVLAARFLLTAHQTHSKNVYCLTKALNDDLEVEDYDALITDQPHVALMVQTADCQPVLLYDVVRKVIGAVHSGWRGSVQNVVAATVVEMGRAFDCHPENIRAAIGPSLGPCCAEFVNYKKELPNDFLVHRAGDAHFDFWRISVAQLQGVGVRAENIEIAGICSRCSEDHFSYRQAVAGGVGITGRLGSAIMLV